eukprot:CFRG8242T1
MQTIKNNKEAIGTLAGVGGMAAVSMGHTNLMNMITLGQYDDSDSEGEVEVDAPDVDSGSSGSGGGGGGGVNGLVINNNQYNNPGYNGYSGGGGVLQQPVDNSIGVLDYKREEFGAGERMEEYY